MSFLPGAWRLAIGDWRLAFGRGETSVSLFLCSGRGGLPAHLLHPILVGLSHTRRPFTLANGCEVEGATDGLTDGLTDRVTDRQRRQLRRLGQWLSHLHTSKKEDGIDPRWALVLDSIERGGWGVPITTRQLPRSRGKKPVSHGQRTQILPAPTPRPAEVPIIDVTGAVCRRSSIS